MMSNVQSANAGARRHPGAIRDANNLAGNSLDEGYAYEKANDEALKY